MTKLSSIRIAIFCALIAVFAAATFALKHNNEPQLVFSEPVKAASTLPAKSIKQLPPHILVALKSICGGCTFADSDGDWRATDVDSTELPERRVTDIQHIGDTWEISYDRGGFARRSYTLFLSNDPEPAVMPSSFCKPQPAAGCSW